MFERLQISARWLDREALAKYISVRVDHIPRLQRAGKLPKPSLAFGPRNPRWWSPDVDAALGRMASLPDKGASRLAQAILEEARR